MFIPRRILFQKNALNYEIGKNIYNFFKDNENVEMIELSNNRIKDKIPGDNTYNFYREGKNTLVVGLSNSVKFQSCKPSAHYQLPLFSGCIGQCEYCYLNTNLGDKPYMKVNVNVDEILDIAQKYINERIPDITIFEGSATSDPLPTEPYAHSLQRAIKFFGNSSNGRFRFVSKYTDVDSLLNIEHNGHTEIRFTLNTNKVIKDYESRTPSMEKRIDGAIKIIKAGYPMGFLIAPVFLYDGWKDDYKNLLLHIHNKLPEEILYPVTFEVISHRYTTRAKNIILEAFPQSKLPMEDEDRTFRYGQFGYGKYVYGKDQLAEMKEFFEKEINEIFTKKEIKYII